jgi:hypothetical protein
MYFLRFVKLTCTSSTDRWVTYQSRKQWNMHSTNKETNNTVMRLSLHATAAMSPLHPLTLHPFHPFHPLPLSISQERPAIQITWVSVIFVFIKHSRSSHITTTSSIWMSWLFNRSPDSRFTEWLNDSPTSWSMFHSYMWCIHPHRWVMMTGG